MTYQRVLAKDHARAAIKGKKPCRRALVFLLLCLLFAFLTMLPTLIAGLIYLPSSVGGLPGEEFFSTLSGLSPVYWLCLSLTLLLIPTAGALLRTGGCTYCLDLWRGRGADSSRFWAGFSRFASVMALGLMITFYALLWALPYVFLSLLVMVFASPLLPHAFEVPEALSFLLELAQPNLVELIILGLTALLFLLLYCNRVLGYSLAFFVLMDHPRFTARQCLRESKALMKGRKWKLVVLLLSFIGWELLAVLIGTAVRLLWSVLLVFFPASTLPGALFWPLRIMLIFYLLVLVVFAVLLPLWLLNYVGVAFAGFYDFALSDDFNRPTPPRSWQVYN